MTTVNDLRRWLDTPGGHSFQAAHGSYSAALQRLIDIDSQERQDAYAANQRRQMNGLRPLTGEAAIEAVRDHRGPQLSGSAQDIRASFRDPTWRLGVSTDDSSDGAIRWDGRSLAMVNFTRQKTGAGPLQQ